LFKRHGRRKSEATIEWSKIFSVSQNWGL
jgi:hypothetical protein